MKIEEIRDLSDEELRVELERLHRHRFDLRAQAVTEKLEDPSMLGKAKRDIARLMTVQRRRELAQGQDSDQQKQAQTTGTGNGRK